MPNIFTSPPTRPLAHCLQTLFVVFFLLTFSSSCLFAANDAQEYEKQLSQLKQNIAKLQTELESVKGEHGKLENKLEKSEVEIGEQLKKINDANIKIKEHNKKLINLQNEKQALQSQRRTQQTQISAQVKSAYKAGPKSQLRLLLNQESPQSIARLMKYHDYVLSARNLKMQQYLTVIERLNTVEPKILSQRVHLSDTQQRLKLHHSELTSEQQVRARTLRQLKKVIASKDSQLRTEGKNQTHLQHLFNEMTTTIGRVNLPARGKKFSQVKGRLPWPSTGEIRHSYGSQRISGQLKWEGLVIGAKTGTPVKAVHNGRVIFAEYLRGQGLLLIIDHGEGYLSLYAHNQSLFRSTGDNVTTGDIIAHIGESGGQNYSGLYFEIRHNGQPTNPKSWLTKA